MYAKDSVMDFPPSKADVGAKITTSVKDDSSPIHRDPSHVRQIREWIEACDRLHKGKCVPTPSSERSPEDVPRWVIDTHKQCIVPGTVAHRYLALSYVWPETRRSPNTESSAPHSLLLDNAGLADFQKEGFLNRNTATQRIPMVIKHAIYLTSAIQERYLWVDRLCIVQNDLGDGGTLSQVAKMDKIYNGAYLTIIAAASEEMYDRGVAVEWPRFHSAQTDPRQRRARARANLHSNSRSEVALNLDPTSEMEEERVTRVITERYATLSRSRWATRGWTYQEQILCTRAIMFLDTGFFFDCQCCVWDGVDLHPSQNLSSITSHSEMGQRFASRWWPDFGFYVDLICPYNGREFSYSQDALLGVSGVLNALNMSFPGGFVAGLPRLYLDHALLWQPFGITDRRIDRSDKYEKHSSLPSWSWCGWQCFVDPSSYLSGLAYFKNKASSKRAGSWRTKRLVDWKFLAGDAEPEPVMEARTLNDYAELRNMVDAELPRGWKRWRVSNPDWNTSLHSDTAFTHDKDPDGYFAQLMPLAEASPARNSLAMPFHLFGTTSTAFIFPATLLRGQMKSIGHALGPTKISVFEDKIFQAGPAEGKVCPILVLQQPNGAFAGLLRLMNEDAVARTKPIELIAISTGSARARDLRESLEWRIYETAREDYIFGNTWHHFEYTPDWIIGKGRSALLFDVAMAFDPEAASKEPLGSKIADTVAELQYRSESKPFILFFNHKISETEQQIADSIEDDGETNGRWTSDDEQDAGAWWNARNIFMREQAEQKINRDLTLRANVVGMSVWGSYAKTRWRALARMLRNGSLFKLTRDAPPEAPYHARPEELLCEFYNVLWIERKDGIAYRKACGWVPKYVWETHSTGSVEVKLG